MYEDDGFNLVGSDAPTVSQGFLTFTFTDATITNNFSIETAWNPASFNGYRIYDTSNTIAAFTSVTLNSISNMVGLTNSNISFDADNSYVNWQGLAFDPTTVVQLDINGGNVPEPATWALMITGFVMVGVPMRRRKAIRAA